MKKALTSILLMTLTSAFSPTLKAQNLVPNPSFEDTVACPTILGEINFAVYWSDIGGSPDYYNICATSTSGVSVPTNTFGYHYAASGNAYAGFWAKDESSGYREWLEAPLLSNLQIGTKYYVYMKVSLSPYPIDSQYCGVNKIGVLFSTMPYHSQTYSNYAQIYADSIITDTLNWVTIHGSFIADSLYAFINIGNFFSDSLTDSLQVAGTSCQAYYYLDDICVSSDSTYCTDYVGIEDIKDENNNFFPNPSTDFIIIKDKGRRITEIYIYDTIGELVKIYSPSDTPEQILNLNGLSQGIYHLVIYKVQNLKPINLKLIKI